MWGKLTERSNRTQTKLISDPKELYRFLATPGIEVVHLVFANDEVVWVSWKFTAEERVPSLRHTNEVIGAYVIAGARIHQSRHLDRLQEKAICCDTDSVIHIQPRDEPQLVETGDNLGENVFRIKTLRDDNRICECWSKELRVYNTRHYKHCEGITLNYNASQLVNFVVINDMILNNEPSHTVTVNTEHKIKQKRNINTVYYG